VEEDMMMTSEMILSVSIAGTWEQHHINLSSITTVATLYTFLVFDMVIELSRRVDVCIYAYILRLPCPLWVLKCSLKRYCSANAKITPAGRTHFAFGEWNPFIETKKKKFQISV
jgi:hypothetical protein